MSTFVVVWPRAEPLRLPPRPRTRRWPSRRYLQGLVAFDLPGGPVCAWFLSPHPQPGRADPVDVVVRASWNWTRNTSRAASTASEAPCRSEAGSVLEDRPASAAGAAFAPATTGTAATLSRSRALVRAAVCESVLAGIALTARVPGSADCATTVVATAITSVALVRPMPIARATREGTLPCF